MTRIPAFSRRAALLGALSAPAALVGMGPVTAQAPEFGFDRVAEGFDLPVFMADPGDGSDRKFVVEQSGRIRLVRAAGIRNEPFLDLSGSISFSYEQGLLGLALHPNFIENQTIFVNFTDLEGTTQVVRYRVSRSRPNLIDPETAQTILSVPQLAANHNAGMLAFGQDGYLYVALGDGGGRGDPGEHGQNLSTLLGSILRLDVDSVEEGYAIPPDNPFVEVEDARPEIWSYGLRNPWRFSIDRETGDLWIGDVGQNAWEEVDFQPEGVGGLNFGWNRAEGFACYADPACESAEGLTWPVFAYGREFGLSVVGGYVYRGSAIPDLAGRYLCGDYGTGYIWVLTPQDDGSVVASDPIPADLTISSFAEDAEGELYVIDLGGAIYQIVPA
jgi:glucose/arabinose dehydrogenase